MTKTLVIWLGLFLSFVAQTVSAADENGRYWIYGVGRQTCSTYLEARRSGGFSEISYKNWISGYLTSSNRSSAETYDLLSNNGFKTALIWLDRYCNKNPSNTVYMAMANLTAVYYPKRKKKK